MEHIIHQKTQELARKIVKRVETGEISELDVLASAVREDCCSTAAEIIEVILEKMNLLFREDKEARQSFGLVMKEKDRDRSIYTALGEIHIKRDYYYDKNGGKYVTPIDDMVGIEKYSRVDDTVKANLVTESTRESYRRSAEIVSCGEISKQTVMNAVLRAEGLNAMSSIEKPKRQVKELHIFADEDHVHMQRPNKEKGKVNQFVPLAVVTEGIEEVSKGRGRTIRAKRFVDKRFKGAHIWEEIEGYIYDAYEVDSIEKIYIHGDGGRWIKNGLERMPNVVHVMDGFHLEKAVKSVSSIKPELNIRNRLNEVIVREDREAAKELLGQVEKEMESKADREKVREFKRYILNNWQIIVNRKQTKITGSCTEGQVSHILSERFSRNPMGWSKEGLGQLSCARVHVLNGEEITKENFRGYSRNRQSYTKYMQKEMERYLSGPFDWGIFERKEPIFDGNSGTMRVLRTYGIS